MHSSKSHPALTFYGADVLPQPMLVLSSQVEMYYQPKTHKIPKPNGEVGQLGWGGYNLNDQLGWGKDGFKKLKRFIKKAVKKHLDPMRCQSLKDHKALETVSKMCWPVQDLVQLQLKYLSFRAWQQQWTRVTPPGKGIKTNMRSQRG
ncbi:hypothetical protein EDC04DRAFT_2609620 [Pisolithus marmoratus]|nr:hypothetical protein EDC04DRAFT_2609620 [Pisolithus marmoratus]